MRIDLLAVIGAFVLGTLNAEVAGAANFGTAMTFGVFAFTATLVWVLIKRP
jgi:uncharacterized membrane protein (DUF485 family)